MAWVVLACLTAVLLWLFVLTAQTRTAAASEAFGGRPRLPVSTDGRCGPERGTRCLATQCCSRWGWCGPQRTAHCVLTAAAQFQGDLASSQSLSGGPSPTATALAPGATGAGPAAGPYPTSAFVTAAVPGTSGAGPAAGQTDDACCDDADEDGTCGELAPVAADTLAWGSFLTSGQSVTSANGLFSLRLQSDGDLVLTQLPATTLWSTSTAGLGQAPYTLAMQSDGDLVVYDGRTKALWSSGTGGTGSSPWSLGVRNDGNVVVTAAGGIVTWQTRTYGAPVAASPASSVATPARPSVPLMFAAAPTLCLTVAADGQTVETDACVADSASQSWGYQPATQQWKVDATGACLALPGGDTADGTRLQALSCDGSSPDQRWETIGGRYLRKPGTNACVDVAGASSLAGGRVQVRSCDGTASQAWLLGSQTIRPVGVSTTCFAAAIDGSVQLSPCSGGADQLFSYLGATQQVRHDASGQCLSAPSANGGRLQLATCDATAPEQGWQWYGGALRRPGANKCVDSSARPDARGTPLGLSDCNGRAQQRFATAAA